jgi:high-affinity iron transporter
MLPTFVIFFREILEISIILSIIVAATRGVSGRAKWIFGGIAGGLLGAGVVAYFADKIAEWMEGMGQEMFNATILLLAAFMIGWTVVWMKTHVRHVVAKIKQVGAAVQQGDMPLYALALVVSVCMWREGSEIVLFMYGVLTATEESIASIVAGGAGGALAAAAIGYGIYAGLIKIPTQHFFKVTEWMLILLAAGLSLQATGYLIAADVVSPIVSDVWDSSWLLAEDSVAGQILHAMVGYTERPALSQLLAYVATIGLILGFLKLQNRPKPKLAVTSA